MNLMSETLRTAICEQIAHERHNASTYLFIASYLKNKGLDNVAKHFTGQHTEETEHSLEFVGLLTDMNASVNIFPLPGGDFPINVMRDISDMYLLREKLTTDSIHEIKMLAMQDENAVVEEMMRRMIAKQQVEYEEATSFADKAELMPEWWQWALYDGAMG